MFGRATKERVAGKATLGAARGAGKVLKGGAKYPAARRAARRAGRVAFKGGRRAVRSSGETFGARWLKYGFFALFGFALGALVARWGKWRDAHFEQELEQRIRTRVGEDPRTSDVLHLNVEVNDGVAEIRGEVHSDDEKCGRGDSHRRRRRRRGPQPPGLPPRRPEQARHRRRLAGSA
jgi:hypothetical protein